jgi:hypothetical protein
MDPAIPQTTKEIFDQIIKPELMWILLRTSVIAIATMVFYNIYKSIAIYISFRANHDIGKNVKLVINGREGFITHYTLRFIHIRLQDTKNEMIIPLKTWENHDWIIIKNGNK